MNTKTDSVILKKLVLVKQLYRQAVIRASMPYSRVNRMLAVITFDLAAESMLKAVVEFLDPLQQSERVFGSLVNKADDLLKSKHLGDVKERAKLLRVHEIRTDAQHKAKYPDQESVSDCRTYTKDFLNQIVHDVWGLSFENVSLLELVGNTKAKDFLRDAEQSLSQADYKKAIENSIAGLQWVLNSVKPNIVGPDPGNYARGFMQPIGGGKAIPIKASRDSIIVSSISEKRKTEAIEKMQETLLHVALGLNFELFVKCKAIAGDVMFDTNDSPVHFNTKENPGREEAEFVTSYCVDAVIEIEDRVGNLERPFE